MFRIRSGLANFGGAFESCTIYAVPSSSVLARVYRLRLINTGTALSALGNYRSWSFSIYVYLY